MICRAERQAERVRRPSPAVSLSLHAGSC